MSAEELRHGAGLQRLIRPVGPVPPDMPTATPPQRPAGPPAIVLPPGEDEATRLHGLAALGTGRGVVGHAAHLNGATASSRSHCGECLTSSPMYLSPAATVRRRPRLSAVVRWRCHAVRHSPLMRPGSACGGAASDLSLYRDRSLTVIQANGRALTAIGGCWGVAAVAVLHCCTRERRRTYRYRRSVTLKLPSGTRGFA